MKVMRTEVVKHKRGVFFFHCGLDREASKPRFKISGRSKTGARQRIYTWGGIHLVDAEVCLRSLH